MLARLRRTVHTMHARLPRPDGEEPKSCPAGHLLEPGLFLRGWRPCNCEAALKNHGGHYWIQCEQCREERWTMDSLQPVCSHRILAKV